MVCPLFTPIYVFTKISMLCFTFVLKKNCLASEAVLAFYCDWASQFYYRFKAPNQSSNQSVSKCIHGEATQLAWRAGVHTGVRIIIADIKVVGLARYKRAVYQWHITARAKLVVYGASLAFSGTKQPYVILNVIPIKLAWAGRDGHYFRRIAVSSASARPVINRASITLLATKRESIALASPEIMMRHTRFQLLLG